MTALDLDELAARAWVYGFPLVFNLDQVARYVTTGIGAKPGHDVQRVQSRSTTTRGTRWDRSTWAVDRCCCRSRQLVARTTRCSSWDAWTNNFAYIGQRATGTEASSYLLTPPGRSGQVPDGAVQLRRFPTRIATITGRWACSGVDDLDRIRRLQQATTLTPVDRDAPAPIGLSDPAPGVAPELIFWEKLRV
jgi:hypothetical protein